MRRPIARKDSYPNIVPVLAVGILQTWKRDLEGKAPSTVFGAVGVSPLKLESTVAGEINGVH